MRKFRHAGDFTLTTMRSVPAKINQLPFLAQETTRVIKMMIEQQCKRQHRRRVFIFGPTCPNFRGEGHIAAIWDMRL